MGTARRLTDASVVTPGLRRFSPRQEEVLDAIEPIVVRDGIRGIRMGELAAEVSCSRSTLYEIAAGKEDLLLLVLDRMMRRIAGRGTAAMASADTNVERIRAMLAVGVAEFARLGPRFLDAVAGHPPARMLFDRWVAVCRDALEHLIAEGIVAREIRPVNPHVVAEMMFAGVLRFTDVDFARTTATPLGEVFDQMVDVMLDGLRPR